MKRFETISNLWDKWTIAPCKWKNM